MKKIISCIIAVTMLMSTLLCGSATVFAAETDDSAVSDVDMWNHNFKNDMSGEVMWAIDDIADTDIVAVKISLASYGEDIYMFADKNDRLDEVFEDENGKTSYSDELLRDYDEYIAHIKSQKPEDKKKIIDEKYSVSEIKYFPVTKALVCNSTKEQILSLADADIKVSIALADKDYYNAGTKITWDEFFKVEKQTRDYIEQTLGYACPESDYDVFYFDLTELDKSINYRYIYVVNREDYLETKILRTGDFVVSVYNSPAGTYFYADNKVQNAAELYTNGVIDIDTMYALGARYYGDLNSDKSTNVNDVTELQMYLNGSLDFGDEDLSDLYEEAYKIYCDLNDDSRIDVNDVTALQDYLSNTRG